MIAAEQSHGGVQNARCGVMTSVYDDYLVVGTRGCGKTYMILKRTIDTYPWYKRIFVKVFIYIKYGIWFRRQSL